MRQKLNYFAQSYLNMTILYSIVKLITCSVRINHQNKHNYNNAAFTFYNALHTITYRSETWCWEIGPKKLSLYMCVKEEVMNSEFCKDSFKKKILYLAQLEHNLFTEITCHVLAEKQENNSK